MTDSLRAIGLMSGTSMDGIDAAMLSTDGETVFDRGPSVSMPYDENFRSRLRSAVERAKGLLTRDDAEIAALERELTEVHAMAVLKLLSVAGMASTEIDLIGFHGHTLDHQPDQTRPGGAMTWQAGDGQLLADLSGIDVVCDFRSNDVAHGGQGAPLLPLYHGALMQGKFAGDAPVVLLNIGGVANLTWMRVAADRTLEMLAFDTGPGNALIDDWMRARRNLPFDADGALAATGKVDADVLAALMEHAYFARTPPKSLDRDDFSGAACAPLSDEDGAATLTAFTVKSIAVGLSHCSATPSEIYVTGGGRHNATLMTSLAEALPSKVMSVDDLGVDGDAVEAEGFAYLAVRSAKGLPISLLGTTGVDQPRSGGTLYRSATRGE